VTHIIDIQNLTYRPDSLPPQESDILKGINLTVEQGSFVAIIGENGSGKTTLLKQINGLLLPTSGRILINGIDTRDQEKRHQLRSIIGMVFQNPSDQIVASTVEEDIAFGLENANIPTPELRKRVFNQIKESGLEDESTRPPHLLSGGQLQKVALAGVLARCPNVILFDEPTSMLDPLSRKSFLKQIYALKQRGMTVIYVTHHVDETVNADQIIVLKNGVVLLQDSPQIIFQNKELLREAGLEIPEIVSISTQLRDLGWYIPKTVMEPNQLLAALPNYSGSRLSEAALKQSKGKETIISIDDVYYTYLAGTPLAKPALKGATLTVAPGTIHGIAGSNGSGKSTLLQHINGILSPANGHIRVLNFILENQITRLRDIVRKVGMVFQSPETQFFEVFVGDEIAYGPKQFGLDDVKERVHRAMKVVGLDFESFKDRRLETLSGGEKRKVALASTLILDQDILLFDEPTAGMDPRARDELVTLFKRLAQEGKTIVIASHRLEELVALSDDISIMQAGKVETTISCDKINSNIDIFKHTGLEPPLVIRVSQKLIEKGWPIDRKDTTTTNKLVHALLEIIE